MCFYWLFLLRISARRRSAGDCGAQFFEGAQFFAPVVALCSPPPPSASFFFSGSSEAPPFAPVLPADRDMKGASAWCHLSPVLVKTITADQQKLPVAAQFHHNLSQYSLA